MTLNQHLPHTNTQHWNWTTLPDETFNSFSFAHKQEINFRHIPFWEKTTTYSISEKLIFQSASTHQTRTKLTISCFTQNVHSLAAFLHREWCVSRCVLIGRRNRIKIAIDLVSNLLLPDRVLSHLRHEGKLIGLHIIHKKCVFANRIELKNAFQRNRKLTFHHFCKILSKIVS